MITRLKILVLLTAVLGAVSNLYGQGSNGTILGTVTDNSGAVVANAKVEVTNVATSVTAATQTTSSGDFTVPFLSPGTYKVTVQAQGFQKAVTDAVGLVVGQQQRVNVSLKPGTVSEIVEVQASAVNLDTDSSAVSQVVTQRQVEDLPLNGRNFMQLLFLDAGAVQTGGEQATFRAGQGAAISVNGSRPESNNYLLDGMLNTDQALNTPAVVLSVDAIQEFKVLSETYSAQYGFAANQISIVSKAGTNSLHGSVFYFGRNDFLDARNYFNPAPTPVAALRQHQFGFVVSGPVMIPKVYDGRNKTFFMADYEGWRVKQGTSSFFNAPSADLLKGLFATDSVIDPTTGSAFPTCTVGAVTYTSCIPAARFSRLANVMIGDGLFPAANCATDPNCINQNANLIQANVVNQKTNQQTYRLDQDLGKWGKVFGRGTYSPYLSSTPNSASGSLGNILFNQAATNWAVSHTVSFGPSKVNQFSFGRLFAVSNTGGVDGPADLPSRLNFSGIFTNLGGGARLYPRVAFAANSFSQFGGGLNAYGISENPMWQFVDNFTLIHGPHTVTIGGDYKRWSLKRNVSNNFLGNFGFDGIATGVGKPFDFADFLLGIYSRAGAAAPGPLTPANTLGNPYEYNFQYFASYIQDDWKVNHRLTLNLGLRWDLRSVPYETQDHFGWIDLTNPNGGICIVDPGVFSGGFSDPTVYRNCGGRSPAHAEKKNFAPRFGFAWRPFGEKTVLRGGYGMFWDGIEGREMDGAAGFYPFAGGATATNQTVGQPGGFNTTNNLFPSAPGGPVPKPVTAVVTLSAPPFLKNPYVQQYTFSIQRELAKNTMLEVNYVGNKGTHLLTRNQINQAFVMSPTLAAFCATFVPPTPVPTQCTVAARRPYSNFGLYIDDRWIGYSNYNAGTVKLEHRASSLALTAAFSWSKSLDNKSAAAGIGASQGGGGWQGYLDNHNPQMDYGRSDFDAGKRMVVSAVYDLPVGKGKRVLNNANTAVNAVLGGWQISTIYTAQLGFPMSIQGQGSSLNDNFGLNRADIVPGQSLTGPKTKTQWFNTAAFTNPATNTLGNSGRNILRQPGLNNFDIGLLKNIDFTERAHLQLRLETFNTFNHPQFAGDLSNPAFAGGGSSVGNSIAHPPGQPPPPNYGRITAASPGRIVQLGGKIIF